MLLPLQRLVEGLNSQQMENLSCRMCFTNCTDISSGRPTNELLCWFLNYDRSFDVFRLRRLPSEEVF
jgi:hypothetical protein